MWERFQRYRALDPEARKTFGRAVALLPLIALSLRIRGFKKTKETLQKKLSLKSSGEAAKERVAEVVQRTCRVMRAGCCYGIVRPTCLVESLALWYLLQKQDVPACLRIGVRKISEQFEAHAWVEYEGVALNQSEEVHEHYAVLDNGFSDLPGAKSRE
jgi:hypothetical protein